METCCLVLIILTIILAWLLTLPCPRRKVTHKHVPPTPIAPPLAPPSAFSYQLASM